MKKIAASGLILASLLACSHRAREQGVPRPASASSSTKEACAIIGKGVLRIVPVTSFQASSPSVLSLTTWSHYVAYVGGDSQKTRTATVFDLASHRGRTVAQHEGAGNLDLVAGGDDKIVYTDLSRDLTDENLLSSPWKEYLQDLAAGDRVLLAHSRNRRDELDLATPHVNWPWLVDARVPLPLPRDPLRLDIVATDLRTRKQHVVVSKARDPAVILISGQRVVFAADSGPHRRDFFSVPLDGSAKPTQITSSGAVSGGWVDSGGLTWQEPLMGDPTSIWFMPLSPPGKPIKVADGGSNVYPGRGFVMWLTPAQQREKLVARQPCSSAEPLQIAGDDLDIGARWMAYADRIVWATDVGVGDEARVTVHVAQLIPE